jgi:hypothetical protein
VVEDIVADIATPTTVISVVGKVGTNAVTDRLMVVMAAKTLDAVLPLATLVPALAAVVGIGLEVHF